MKNLILSILMNSLIKLVKSDEVISVVEVFLRKLAKRTDTQIDDVAVDVIISALRKTSQISPTIH